MTLIILFVCVYIGLIVLCVCVRVSVCVYRNVCAVGCTLWMQCFYQCVYHA